MNIMGKKSLRGTLKSTILNLEVVVLKVTLNQPK
jgi:hypothetical protein